MQGNVNRTQVDNPKPPTPPPEPGRTPLRQKVLRWARDNVLTIAVLLGVLAGIILGVALKTRTRPYTAREVMYVGFVGEMFLRMLKGLIIPLIVSTLISAIGKLDIGLSGRMGGLAILYYLITTLLAITTGIVLVTSISPGAGGNATLGTAKTAPREVMLADALLDLLRNVFPSNVFEATMYIAQTTLEQEQDVPIEQWQMNHGMRRAPNFLGLIVFSIVCGIALASLKETGRPLLLVLENFASITLIITNWLMYISPVGIAFLVASSIIREDDYSLLFAGLGKYVLTVLLGLLIHGLVMLPLLYSLCTRSWPFTFIYNMAKASAMAFSTASSSATIPVTVRCLEVNNAVDKRVTRFVVPIGAVINMDGTALYEGVAAIFIAQVLGKTLSTGDIVMIVITATTASIGAAGIPSAGLVTMVMVLDTVNISSEHVGIILAVDWILDRCLIDCFTRCP